MGKFSDYREASKTRWGRNLDDGEALSREDLQFGCMLRIADATEAMAKNHIQLQKDRDIYERLYNEKREALDKLQRSHNADQGVKTRQKQEIDRLRRELSECRLELLTLKAEKQEGGDDAS